MSKVIVTESYLEDIGDAIRSKLGGSDTYKPSEMAGAISQIHGDPVLEALSVTENGTYDPSSGKDGFSQAVVNVPNSYSAGDEGKVVSNGALVAQTSDTVTENDTYDTTLINQLTVNVSGGGGSATLYTNGQMHENEVQITNVSGFTKIYDTTKPFGSNGTKVDARLDETDESAIETFMSGGWNRSGMPTYDTEGQIGAYGGYTFGEALDITKAKFWIGRYSGQNNTLKATIQYLDENNTWQDIETFDVSTTIPYPVNVFICDVYRTCYGLRWIHRDNPLKTSGNTITFAGMTIYEGTGEIIDVYIPSTTGLIEIPSGYDGFGTLYIP